MNLAGAFVRGAERHWSGRKKGAGLDAVGGLPEGGGRRALIGLAV